MIPIYRCLSRRCTVSSLAYLESKNRITSISSAASGPSASQERRPSLYLVVESLCLPRSRARSYNAEATVGARGGCGLLRFIDLSPSTFTLPSHMPHPTPAFLRRRTFLLASCDAVDESIREDAGKKAGHLLSTKCPSIEAELVTPEEGHKGPLVKIILRDPKCFR